jgi:uncharacterized repeat protein (TIGR01451 family)
VQLNDIFTFRLEVANVGDAPAENVVVDGSLSPGLLYQPKPEEDFHNRLILRVGSLAPGKVWRDSFSARAAKTGEQDFVVLATGAGGLRETGRWAVRVDEPKLTLTIAGPKKRLIDSIASYRLTLSNTGTADVTGLEVFAELPAGVKFVDASDGGRASGGRVQWRLPALIAGRPKAVEFLAKGTEAGEKIVTATARADRALTAKEEVKTLFEGAAGLHVDVDLRDAPLAVGGEGDLVVRVTNTGKVAATNVGVRATLPAQVELSGKPPAGVTVDGRTLTFAPLASLAAGKSETYTIHFKVKEAGAVKFTVEVTAADLTKPLIEEEATTIGP